MAEYTLNCDCDEILYRAAFAAEKRGYKIKQLPSGNVFDFATKYKREDILFQLGLQGKSLNLDYELITYPVVMEPLNHVLNRVNGILKHLNKIGPTKLWMTSDDKSNFRYQVANTEGPYGTGYKAGRQPRPFYYQDVRKYLLEKGATEVFGEEADDALGRNQTDTTVAVHQDKDINRIPGKHYNWRTKERYIVEQPGKLWLRETLDNKGRIKRDLQGHGNKWFFAQMLLGDRVDNIPGVGQRFGDVKVFNYLDKYDSEYDMYKRVEDKYYQEYEDEYLDKLYEIADLLYIIGPEGIRGNEYIRGFA